MVGSTESKVFSLYGALLDDGEYAAFSLSTLYAFLGPLGVSEEATRLALSRMARKGYLRSRRRGRASFYFLEEAGRLKIAAAVARSVGRRSEEPWDGRFRLVSYEFPEERRDERAALAAALADSGFARAAAGLWAAAVDPGPALAELLASPRLAGLASSWSAEYRGDAPGFARGLFRLDERAAGIRAFRERFLAETEGLSRAVAAGERPSDAECFRRYFDALTDYVELMGLVPPLPPELLPGDWPAPSADEAYARYRDLVREGTNAYVAAHYEAYGE